MGMESIHATSIRGLDKYVQHDEIHEHLLIYCIVGKVKCSLVQALRLYIGRTAHRGTRGIALLFLDHGTRRGWRVSVTPRPFFTPGKDPVPLYRRLGGPQGQSGQVRKISPPPGFDSLIVQPVASRYTVYATRPTIYYMRLTTLKSHSIVYWNILQNIEPETRSISVSKYLCVISGFSSEVGEIFAFLRNYIAYGGTSYRRFRKTYCYHLSCPETSVRNYRHTPCN